MKLVVGLGNPGVAYDDTPHNIGFSAVDALASNLNACNWSKKSKFLGDLATSDFQGNSFMLLKPSTYMNLSGKSVAPLVRYKNLESSSMLVISDDIELPLGKIRFRCGGGHGGHNGLKSIIQMLGTGDFYRLRIGVGRSSTESAADYVLSKWSKSKLPEVLKVIDFSVDIIIDYILGDKTENETFTIQ